MHSRISPTFFLRWFLVGLMPPGVQILASDGGLANHPKVIQFERALDDCVVAPEAFAIRGVILLKPVQDRRQIRRGHLFDFQSAFLRMGAA